MEQKNFVGKIISISDLNVTILLGGVKVRNREILETEHRDQTYRFEVFEAKGSIIFAIPLDSVIGLKRGLDVYTTGKELEMEYSDRLLGRVYDSYGAPIDGLPEET